MQKMMGAAVVGVAVIVAGCTSVERDAATLSRWSFSSQMILPTDRSLTRAEDGVTLTDGRLIVADQVYGLRLVEADGSNRPFGKFAEAGYLHSPQR